MQRSNLFTRDADSVSGTVAIDEPSGMYQKLCGYIAQFKRVAVACSGGADSALLLKAAIDALHENALPVMVVTEVTIKRELQAAKVLCEELGAELNIINVSLLSCDTTNLTDGLSFSNNPHNRCYICKRAMFVAINGFAKTHGIKNIIEGTNASDVIADRPGFVAITGMGVISPLRECGLTKSNVRYISRQLGLNTWDAPSNSCLATRFAYGESLTIEKLNLVEKAEDFLVANGIKQVRVKVGNW